MNLFFDRVTQRDEQNYIKGFSKEVHFNFMNVRLFFLLGMYYALLFQFFIHIANRLFGNQNDNTYKLNLE